MRSTTQLDLDGVFVPKPSSFKLKTSEFDPKYISDIKNEFPKPKKPDQRTNEPVIGIDESVIGTDERIRIQNTNQYPFSSIGFLYLEYIYQGRLYTGNGTATVVAPNVIITCAHNVFAKQYRVQATVVKFYPGLNGRRQFGQINVKKPFLYPQNYPFTQDDSVQQRDYDWAFLVLEQNVPTGIEPVPIIVDYPQKNRYIGVFGYPVDRNQYNKPNIFMYGMFGVYRFDPTTNLIYYIVDTNSGQSGSALIISQSFGRIGIIGLHTIGDYYKRYNSGNRLTTQKLNYINMRMLRSFGQQVKFHII